ncbi:hypothetical protein Hanom_Chr00s000020g01616821 [Helianthus anomalus]
MEFEMGFASAFASDPFPFHRGPITTFTKQMTRVDLNQIFKFEIQTVKQHKYEQIQS